MKDQFTVGRAFGLFALFYLGQIVVGMIVGMAIGIYEGMNAAMAQSKPDAEAITAAIQVWEAHITVLALFCAAVLAVVLAKQWAQRDWAVADGVGWRKPESAQLLHAIVVGVIGGGLVYVCTLWVPMDRPVDQTVFAKFLASGATGLVLFAVMALLIAPIVEEIVFRGFMLGAFTRRWGKGAALLVTVLIFGAIHLPQTWYYWPAIAGTFGLGVITAWMRLRSGSVLPAIATHFCYNLFPVVGAIAASGST